MLPTIEQLLGPAGALALAIAALWVVGKVVQILWRDHQAHDAQVEAQRDAAFADLKAQATALIAAAQSQGALAKEVGALAQEVAAAVKGIAAIRRDIRKP